MKNLIGEFEKLKKNGRSFLGIDGGNIRSPIWFCGIEFGGKIEDMEEYYKSPTVKFNSIEEFDLPIPYRKDAGDYKRSFYDRFLSAMYINLFVDEKLKNGYNISARIDEIIENELYNINSQIFKLNLYPLGKKDTSWDKEITNKTLITKDQYYNEIFDKRKMFLKELVNKFEPPIIICTVTNGMEEEFVNAFLNRNQIISISSEYIKTTVSKKEFKISKYKTNKTTIIVIPFLGRCNLNSYNDVIEMANHLRDKYL